MTAAVRLSSLVLVALLCAAPLSAFPNGAPTEACLRGMLPNHRGARSGNIATMPFSITRQTTADGIRVTIEPLQANTYFRGFMVMAREPRGRSWAKNKGAWKQVDNVHLLNECSSITHADRSEKARVSITWKGDPNVDLYATLVQSYETFWAEIPVEEAAPQRSDSVAPQRAVVTSRPFERPEFAPIVDQSHFNIQEFFRQQ